MIKTLLGSVREYKKDSLLSPFFVILESLLEIIIPFLMAGLIDYGLNQSNTPYLVRMGSILIIASLVSLIFGVLSGKYAARAAAGFAKNLRRDMFYNIQNFSFQNLNKFSVPSLVTRLTTDVTNVQLAYQMIIRVLIRAPILLIFALIMSININWRISLVFLVAIPVLGISLIFIATKAHPFFEHVFKRYDFLNQVVQENISAIRVVKAYVREEHETQKFKNISDDIYQKFIFAEKIIAWNAPVMQFVMYTVILLISWFAGQFIVVGSMTTGQLTSLIVYATQILSSLMMISMVFTLVIMADASAQRIVEVINEGSTLKNSEQPLMKVPNGEIQFNNVNFSYQDDSDSLVLQDIDLKIKSGETIGIIGGTGSAKSTFVQLIPRLYDVTDGQIMIGGHDVREYDLEVLRDKVSMVLQKNVLFSGTIKENLLWGNPHATDKEVIHACKIAQAHDFIMEFPNGYDTYIEQGGTNVSGGQKQRLCIARALLKNPKILILDDSTSAVDTKTEWHIRQGFRENLKNTTKIIIAQRISSVEDADRVIVMDNGHIDAFDTPENLLRTNKIYQEVYETQLKGAQE